MLYYVEVCNELAGSISASLHLGNSGSFEEMLQRWRTIGNTVCDLTGAWFEPQTSFSRHERVIAAQPTGQSPWWSPLHLVVDMVKRMFKWIFLSWILTPCCICTYSKNHVKFLQLTSLELFQELLKLHRIACCFKLLFYFRSIFVSVSWFSSGCRVDNHFQEFFV